MSTGRGAGREDLTEALRHGERSLAKMDRIY
jgi:hypothetical protein